MIPVTVSTAGEACGLGAHGLVVRWICSAIASRENGFSVIDDGDDCAGDLVGSQLLGHKPVDHGCELVTVRRRSQLPLGDRGRRCGRQKKRKNPD